MSEVDMFNKTISNNNASHVKVMADGKVMKIQKTRQRKILSCIYCHSKKIKCSRVQPVCNNCSKLKLECKYFANERVSRGGKKKSITEPNMQRTNSASSSNGSNVTGSLDSYTGNGQHIASPNTSPPLSPHTKELPEKFFDNNQFDSIKSTENDVTSVSPASAIFTTSNFYHGANYANGSSKKPVLQPMINQSSNNITNTFFNSSFAQPEEVYAFNMSSFPFAGDSIQSPLSFPNLMKTGGTSTPPGQSSSSVTASTIYSLMKKKDVIQEQQKQQEEQRQQRHQNYHYERSKHLEQQSEHPTLQNSLTGFPSNPETTVNYLFGTNTNYNNEQLLNELLKSMPRTRERSNELVDRYVNSVHILLPIMCNLEDFLSEHVRFWDRKTRQRSISPDSPESQQSSGIFNHNHHPEDLQFLTLYFPVLYAATISEFEEYDNLLLNEDINMYLKAFNKICQYHNYPHGLKTIPLLLGNVIIQSTSPNPSTMEMSQIIRYAKFLQMHKDPTLTLRITDWKVVKFRRMLWWTIFGLDALTSHNFCLPPVCKYEDFNVLMPNELEPTSDDPNSEKRLNIGVLSLRVKFMYDTILSDLVYQLHGVTTDISPDDTEMIKRKIIELFEYVHKAISQIADNYRVHPPSSVQEMNLVNFIKNHSWSYVDRALMLLHKKILMGSKGIENKDAIKSGNVQQEKALVHNTKVGGLSLSQYEDTFASSQESNIITNFDRSTISQLKFSQDNNFTYENLHNNLIPSILHNLNDFLKYNDFIKFGKYNWYVKRTIPLDSIILMYIVITVKFKYEFMTVSELAIYVKLINKALFILNRKWFKNEKYKRMLSLANSTWEFMLKKYNIINIINQQIEPGSTKGEYFDYQVSGCLNMNDLFSVMDVPQPISKSSAHQLSREGSQDRENNRNDNALVLVKLYETNQDRETELVQLKEKIYYDLRNNYVDINDYCAFYTSLEDIIRELMDYINS